MKIIGIYKITCIKTKKVYIGQSRDVNYRLRDYKRLRCDKQPKIHNSLLKYGVENHTFEIIEECAFEKLNERERYWQDYYDVMNRDKGLNCVLQSTDEKPSVRVVKEETRAKISKVHKGRKKTIKERRNISKALMGHSLSENTKRKISEANKGNKWTEESRKLASINRRGESNSNYKKTLMINKSNGNVEFEGSVGEFCSFINITQVQFCNWKNKKQRAHSFLSDFNIYINEELIEFEYKPVKMFLNLENGIFLEMNKKEFMKMMNLTIDTYRTREKKGTLNWLYMEC